MPLPSITGQNVGLLFAVRKEEREKSCCRKPETIDCLVNEFDLVEEKIEEITMKKASILREFNILANCVEMSTFMI